MKHTLTPLLWVSTHKTVSGSEKAREWRVSSDRKRIIHRSTDYIIHNYIIH